MSVAVEVEGDCGGRLDATDMKALGDVYVPERLLGEGTYGIVFKARNPATGACYAIKKLRLDGLSEGIPATTIREVTLLHDLNRHPNIVRLLDVICCKQRVYLVFELLQENLRQFIRRYRSKDAQEPVEGSVVPLPIVKDFTRQMLHALWNCHNNRIIHRDLKPDNILVAEHKDRESLEKRFRVKLADFGLARTYEMSLQTLTNEVMTLWYRAPEVLLGERHYTPAADIWSVGCVVAEMVLGFSLFRGENAMDQLTKIFYVVGTPTEATWPGVTRLPGYQSTFKVYRVAPLPSRLPTFDKHAVEFFAFLLQTNPKLRPTITSILQHPFLADD